MEELCLNESYSSEEDLYKFGNSDEEEMKFSRKKNINRITSSDSNIDKCNCNDSEFNEDIIDEVLQELIIKAERKVDNIEKNTIQFSKL